MDFIYGSIAGLTDILVIYPLELLKTHRHLYPHQSVLNISKEIYSNYGWKGFYRGLSAPLCIETPRRGLKLFLQRKYYDMYPNHVIAGILSGMSEAMITTPFEVTKIQMQSSKEKKQLISTMKEIGIPKLWKGYGWTASRTSMWNTTFFAVIDHFQKHSTLPNFAIGMIAGVFSTVCNNPIDVIKSRVQVSTQSISGFSVFRSIVQENPLILYRGFGIKCLRQSIGSGIITSVFFAFQSSSSSI